MPLFLNYSEILWKYICNYSSYCVHPPLYHNIAAPFKSEWSISPHLESELPLPLTLIKGAMVSQFWAWATGGLAVSPGSVGILLSPWEQLLDNPWRMSDMWPTQPITAVSTWGTHMQAWAWLRAAEPPSWPAASWATKNSTCFSSLGLRGSLLSSNS